MTTLSDLVELLYKTRDKGLLEDLFLGLTTPYERKILLKRIDIAKRLLNNEPQHEIARDINVGVSTVTRGAREIELGRFKVLRRNQRKI